MVVTFVGFVGAVPKRCWASMMCCWGHRRRRACVTWFTFLPSFIFILAGGPFIGNDPS
ncbi:hypothetical protein LNP74_29950 [Klebsiella pneumoniae subsp. pneumoniae]|nr:hypothetical protein [Klebsiella pneumoniae subsp. pneumoniae]